jgi:ElaB/YqjD/DUF883 family membrane-anchored ribosome-binding protein
MAQEHTSLADTAGQVAAQAGEKMGQAVDMAKQQTTSRLEDGREQVAASLYTTAHALRQTGQQLREQDQGTIATLADRTAQQAERGSGYLRGRDVPGLLDDTEQLGRAHPVIFAGGALALGLLGVRFLKSSRQPQETPETSPQPQLQLPAPSAPLPVPSAPPPTVGTDATVAASAPPTPLRGPAEPAPVRVSDDAPIPPMLVPPVLAGDVAGRAPVGTGARDAEDARQRAQAAGQRTPGTPGGRPRDTPAGS